MKNLLQEIKSLPSIIGSFIYVESEGVKHSNLPRVFMKESISQVGRSMNKLFAMNNVSGLSVNSTQIYFDESVAHACRIDDKAVLITICDPNANITLLNRTSNMLVNELKNAINKPKQGGTSAEILPDAILNESDLAQIDAALNPLDATPQSDTTSIPDLEQLLSDSPISDNLNGMQDALIKAIGPIGGIIMGDTLEKWGQNGACSKERLNELADLLCQEIDNAKLEKEFRTDIAKYLK